MFFDINLDKNSPVYIQISHYIRSMILKGMIRANEKLPSTRELASILKVSRNTIISSYELLEDDGFISIKKGKGAFVSNVNIHVEEKWTVNWEKNINDYAKKAENLDIIKHEIPWEKGMISFKSISPDESLFDLDEFKKAFLNRFSLEGEKILNYGYAIGYRDLINYLMKYMKNKGVDTSNKKILITNGFTEGFDIVLSSLIKPRDKVLCENPTHNTAIKIMKMHNVDIVGIDMENDGINIDKLKETISNNDIKLTYLIPSYHNPTGIVMSPEKRIKIYNILKDNNIPIIEDGFNEELRYSGDHVSPMIAFSGKGNSIIYIGSFSKVLFPGIRIGWVLADENLVDYLESVKRSRNIHTSFLDQAILYEYLNSGSFEKYIKKSRKIYKHKYEFALKCAKKYIPSKYITGEGGLHIFIKLKNIKSRELLQECCKKGVIFTPGDIFYVDNKGEDTFRLGISRVSLQEIEKGFKIIGDVVKNL
ncbi:PLP-dependent aminotransferase family protein [Clostridium sp. Marseille-Q2269]|uniref:MocR-like pyridoxine biosynthesis transcription factor PdxR n=1 Tax=Clostridium sp. Marseille-Q2269 TaxID=2942205 RepID=UPI002073A9E1|nr:PLP-dependent aminotransferase family protein [Clostridium sp. Marseille-Q2269]